MTVCAVCGDTGIRPQEEVDIIRDKYGRIFAVRKLIRLCDCQAGVEYGLAEEARIKHKRSTT